MKELIVYVFSIKSLMFKSIVKIRPKLSRDILTYTLLVTSLLTLELVNGHVLSYTRAQFGAPASQSGITQHGISLENCVRQCALRPWCRLLAYQRRLALCVLYEDTSPLNSNYAGSSPRAKSTVYIKRDDIVPLEVSKNMDTTYLVKKNLRL